MAKQRVVKVNEWDLLTPSQRRVARLKAAREKGRHTNAEWLELKRFFQFRCLKCGWQERPFEQCSGTKFVMERDHVVPISQGGCDCIANIQPLCNSCNSQKGAESGKDYRWIRIQSWRLSHNG